MNKFSQNQMWVDTKLSLYGFQTVEEGHKLAMLNINVVSCSSIFQPISDN